MNEMLALVAFFALLALLLSRMLRQIGQPPVQSWEDADELLTSGGVVLEWEGQLRLGLL
jgi:hypothetical protein